MITVYGTTDQSDPNGFMGQLGRKLVELNECTSNSTISIKVVSYRFRFPGWERAEIDREGKLRMYDLGKLGGMCDLDLVTS